jgi:hypothetical protein
VRPALLSCVGVTKRNGWPRPWLRAHAPTQRGRWARSCGCACAAFLLSRRSCHRVGAWQYMLELLEPEIESSRSDECAVGVSLRERVGGLTSDLCVRARACRAVTSTGPD